MQTLSPTQSSSLVQPSAWLRELAHLKPARWRWGHSIRAALGMGIPLAVGLITDNIASMMFIALGALQQSMAERDAPYSERYKKVAIAAPIGALSFLLGYLNGLPWAATVAIMSGIAFLSAILSSYSAALSAGCLQMLVMGAVFVGLPALAPYWPSVLMLLLGALIHVVLLTLEVLLNRHRPDHEMTMGLLQALANLAEQRAEGNTEDARQRVTDQLAMLYGVLLQRRRHALGPNAHLDQAAALLQRADSLFALLMSTSERASLQQTASDLKSIANAYETGARQPVVAENESRHALSSRVAELGAALWGHTSADAPTIDTLVSLPRQHRMTLLLDRLTPGSSVVQSALALALCTALAYSVYWLDDKTHWYWVPMTVCIVMKPDMGSIFVRAVHRSVGTSVGVVIGSFIMVWVHPGVLFVLLMVAISALLPWLAQRSYALMAMGLTPLVLILIEFSSPAAKDIDYALLRLAYTLLGSAIVLVFGYLIWPRSHSRQMASEFLAVRQQIADYLRVSVAAAAIRDAPEVRLRRRQAYSALSSIRTKLQQALSEPPPAGHEAATWFPAISGAARVCDAITAYSSQVHRPPSAEDIQQVNQLASIMTTGLNDPIWRHVTEILPETSQEAHLINQICDELRRVRDMVQPLAPD